MTASGAQKQSLAAFESYDWGLVKAKASGTVVGINHINTAAATTAAAAAAARLQPRWQDRDFNFEFLRGSTRTGVENSTVNCAMYRG